MGEKDGKGVFEPKIGGSTRKSMNIWGREVMSLNKIEYNTVKPLVKGSFTY